MPVSPFDDPGKSHPFINLEQEPISKIPALFSLFADHLI
jgi:hypothetical protein